jgi:hypothetical protein
MIKYYIDSNDKLYANPTSIYGLEEVENPIYNGEILPEHKAIEYKDGKIVSPQEVLDLQAQAELDKVEAEKKAEAQAYLNDTDWYITRQAETGVEIPQEVKNKRQECREIL